MEEVMFIVSGEAWRGETGMNTAWFSSANSGMEGQKNVHSRVHNGTFSWYDNEKRHDCTCRGFSPIVFRGWAHHEEWMETELAASQLYNACHVLFGSEIDVSADFLRYLEMPGLKAVYRKKALETHPDRAMALDCQSPVLEERFKEVNAAYQELRDYLENPRQFKVIDDRFRKWQHNDSQKAHPRPKAQAHRKEPPRDGRYARFCEGTVPKRELLFGQYVYYYGYISFRQLVDAIVWQKFQRPSVGKLAMRWGWLYEDDVWRILTERQRGEKFGEAALRGGYLTPERLRLILWRQRMLQPRIGNYFVEKKILPDSLVEAMAEQARRHNWLYRSR